MGTAPEHPSPRAMHRAHRGRLLELLAERGAAALFPAAPVRIRSHDSEHRYRPDSDLWYLTGFDEPEAALFLSPKDGGRSVLFLRERDREAEVWSGRRLGVEAAPDRLGVDQAYPIGELWKRLAELARGHRALVCPTGVDGAFDRRLLRALGAMRKKARSPLEPPTELLEPSATLHELRLRKSDEELSILRRAAAITAEAHAAAMAAARPGVGENELDALLTYTFLRRGATGSAYGNIVAGGANATILHYVRNDRPLAAGELVLVDAGAEVEYYASDVTRTFPVAGTFTEDQRRLYEVVLRAQLAAIDGVRPGATVDSVHDLAVRSLCEGLVELGLLEGPAEEAVAHKRYERLYMHRTSHWLGLDVHDRGAYVVEGAPRPLEPGMVLTVEPGLYVAPDDEAADERWRGVGVRIEDDVLVTAGGREVLTAAVPKTPEEIEAACGGRALRAALSPG